MTFATSNMVPETKIININDEIKLLTNLFQNNGWQQINDYNLKDHIVYSRQGNETEFFEIMLDNNKIYVSVPLKNSAFQYKTKFDNYYSAIKYIETKFYYFTENENKLIVASL